MSMSKSGAMRRAGATFIGGLATLLSIAIPMVSHVLAMEVDTNNLLKLVGAGFCTCLDATLSPEQNDQPLFEEEAAYVLQFELISDYWVEDRPQNEEPQQSEKLEESQRSEELEESQRSEELEESQRPKELEEQLREFEQSLLCHETLPSEEELSRPTTN